MAIAYGSAMVARLPNATVWAGRALLSSTTPRLLLHLQQELERQGITRYFQHPSFGAISCQSFMHILGDSDGHVFKTS